MRVQLSWQEVALAAQVGIRRHICALMAGLPDTHGRGAENGWTDHIEGACGELAAAKALNVYWTPTVNTFKRGGDVGVWQVRTRSQPTYELNIRDGDQDEAPFVLVRGQCPVFDVVGWILGRDGKRLEWRATHGGRAAAFFVPDAHLRPLAELGAQGERP